MLVYQENEEREAENEREEERRNHLEIVLIKRNPTLR